MKTKMPTEFFHPSTFMVAGPTQCGKTSFVIRLLRNADSLFSVPPKRIFWLYKDRRAAPVEELAGLPISFVQGVDPDFKKRAFSGPDLPPTIVVIDDLMTDMANSKMLEELFVEGSHHANATVIYIVQNLFQRSPKHRTAAINSHYLALFNMPRDYSQVARVGQQMRRKYFMAVYEDAINSRDHGYLLVDCRSDTDDRRRLRTGVLPGEESCIYGPPGLSSI